MGSQYKGNYLINWTVTRTFTLWSIIKIYLFTHVLYRFETQIETSLVDRKGNLSRQYSFRPVINTVVFFSVLLVVYVGGVCVVLFVEVSIYVVLYLILTDAVFVFTVLWIVGFWTALWTGLLQKILSRYLILQVGDNDRKPSYHVDTTQKQYPRIRLPCRGLIYTGKKLFPQFDEWLDDHKDYDIDLPDVEEVPGNHCICSFVMKLHPPDPIHSFVVYLCDCREDDAFYELCSAFDVPENVRVKIATNNSSMVIRCFDALHRVYHRDKELTLPMIKAKLSEYSDELQQIISDYHEN